MKRLKNLAGLLTRPKPNVGATPADVVKVSVFLTDVDDRPRINPLREAFFGSAARLEMHEVQPSGVRAEIVFSPIGEVRR